MSFNWNMISAFHWSMEFLTILFPPTSFNPLTFLTLAWASWFNSCIPFPLIPPSTVLKFDIKGNLVLQFIGTFILCIFDISGWFHSSDLSTGIYLQSSFVASSSCHLKSALNILPSLMIFWQNQVELYSSFLKYKCIHSLFFWYREHMIEETRHIFVDFVELYGVIVIFFSVPLAMSSWY